MTVLDGIVLLVLIASVVRSLLRGLIEEIFSLGAWIIAFLGGKWGAVAVGPFLPMSVQSEGLRYFSGFAVVFLLVLVAVMFLGHLLKGAVSAVGLGAVDKLVGAIFGVLRAMVILVGFTLAAGLTSLPRTDFWKNAAFSASLEAMSMVIRPLLPADLAKHIHYR